MPYHKQYLLPTSCEVTKLKSGQKVLAVSCKTSLKVYRRIHLGQNMQVSVDPILEVDMGSDDISSLAIVENIGTERTFNTT